MGPDGDLWQEVWYVGQVRHVLFVLHAVKRQKNVQDVSTRAADRGGDGFHRISQHPHVVIRGIVLLDPRPFLELQILDVLHHLRTAQDM